MKAIETQGSIAREQADVLAKALGNARIDIVGGDGSFLDKFTSMLAVGKGIDGAIARSSTLQTVFKDHLAGERDMIADVREIVGALGGASGELQNLSVAALLSKVARDGNDKERAALRTLLDSFK